MQNYYEPNSTLANGNLKWETTHYPEPGDRLFIFKNRLFGSIDIYKNSTKDLLDGHSNSAISGFTATYDNVVANSAIKELKFAGSHHP